MASTGGANAQTDGDVVFTTLDLLNRHGSFSSDSQSHELQLIYAEGRSCSARAA